MKVSRGTRLSLRVVALGYLFALVGIPIAVILWRTFAPGLSEFVASISTPAAQSALNLSLLIVAITVPVNVVFGVATALALVRGWFGAIDRAGFKVIFGLPGMILATIFVTLPFVVREVEPVLHEIGLDQEQAASTLGANPWQTFWRITLPAIRWGLTYGVVLTIARALGEFGAVIMVSSGFPGVSQTLTLLVHSRYIDDHNTFGAYSAATLLMGLALVTLLGMTLLDRKRSST